jgi:hypothetical protein
MPSQPIVGANYAGRVSIERDVDQYERLLDWNEDSTYTDTSLFPFTTSTATRALSRR